MCDYVAVSESQALRNNAKRSAEENVEKYDPVDADGPFCAAPPARSSALTTTDWSRPTKTGKPVVRNVYFLFGTFEPKQCQKPQTLPK